MRVTFVHRASVEFFVIARSRRNRRFGLVLYRSAAHISVRGMADAQHGRGEACGGTDRSPTFQQEALLTAADPPKPAQAVADKAPPNRAKFLQGNLMRHVVVMSLSSSVGLLSVFIVDFVDLFFISLLGEAALAAAVGFAGTILFFNMSATIGVMIAMGALAAQRIGRGEEEEARRIATSVAVVGFVIGTFMAAGTWIYAPQFLGVLGAVGETRDFAVSYLRIVTPTLPVMMVAMVCSGLLRAHGDARRAMNATLSAGVVNAILDPILIFGLFIVPPLGLDGAAYASAAARLTMACAALYPVIKHYGGFAPFDWAHLRRDLGPILAIAVPAVLTNIATPVGNFIVTRAIAPYGDAAMAGYSVIGRLSPLAFCVIFALSGAVGPIIGQNFGARNFGRVRTTLTRALQFTAGYTVAVWAILIALHGSIAQTFGLRDLGETLVFWFAVVITPLFFFNGVLFVTNASFNNLNRPVWSTLLNWGRNTLGAAPFAFVGGALAGAPGVLVGHALGGVLFAVVGAVVCRRLIRAYETGRADPDQGWKVTFMRPRPAPPFSSPRV